MAADFNKSQDKIHLIIEVIPNASARDTISTEIAAGAGPDIVGPVGWVGSNAFAGQWLDIAPYLAATKYDTTKFEAALVKSYQTEAGHRWSALRRLSLRHLLQHRPLHRSRP